MKKTFFLVLIIFASLKSHSQAIRFNYLGITAPLKTGSETYSIPVYYGIGYEQNIGSRIAVSLEYNHTYPDVYRMILSEEFNHYGTINTVNGNSIGYEYDIKYPMHEIAYQSKFFFRDNDNHAWYFSTGISLIVIEYKWQIRNEYEYSGFNSPALPADFSTGTFSESVSSVPINLKMGFRTSIDKAFSDIAFGLRFNVSGDKNPTNKTYKYVNEVSSLRDISFVMSLSFGFGWAKEKGK